MTTRGSQLQQLSLNPVPFGEANTGLDIEPTMQQCHDGEALGESA